MVCRMIKLGVVLCVATLNAHALTQEELWSRPIKMDRVGVSAFFSGSFNARGFGPYSLRPLMDFLSYGRNTHEPVSFALRILDLFQVRLKEATWLNPYDVLDMHKAFHHHVSPLVCELLGRRSNQAKKALYDALLMEFSTLKKNPEAFINDVATTILAISDVSEVNSLRSLSIKLIESMLDRLIWSPEDEDAWIVTKNIADGLYTLYEDKLIPDVSTLNSCLWTLVYRLCYIIETVGEEFPLKVYQDIKHDIAAGDSVIFAFPDNHGGLVTPRAQWLRTVVIAGEARARQVLEGNWVAPVN